MGGSIEESHPLAVQLPFPFHLTPKSLVSVFQIGESGVQPPGQLIQTAAQFADLVPARFTAFPVEVQFRHLPGNPAHAHDGPGDVSRVNKGAQQRKHQ